MPRDRDGLRRGSLSQAEVIAQSLANIAPTATPAMGIPFLLALSGNASWLACLLAMLAIACIAHQIGLFARNSNSAGSLYFYVERSLGPACGLITAVALLIAYLATGCAVTAGFIIYVYSFVHSTGTASIPAVVVLSAIAVFAAGFLAFRDVHISARVMLGIEAVSILLIVLLFFLPGPYSILHLDFAQLLLKGAGMKQLRAGLVFSIFSFVGFESATTLGDEARNPEKAIPRAVMLTAWIAGVFFVLSAYTETYAFAGESARLSQAGAPLALLAELRHLTIFVPLVGVTTICSFFACTLACITAASRIFYKLSHDGRLFRVLGRSNPRHHTPHVAILLASLIILLVLTAMGVAAFAPFDIYGIAGTFGTYGFITAYLLVSAGAARLLVTRHELTFGSAVSLCGSFFILLLASASSFDSGPGIYRILPWTYLVIIAVGGLFALLRGGKGAIKQRISNEGVSTLSERLDDECEAERGKEQAIQLFES